MSMESTELEGGTISDEIEASDTTVTDSDTGDSAVDSTEDIEDSLYVDSTELIGNGVTTVPEQGVTTVVVASSEEVDTFENSGFEISVIFMLGLIAGLMLWNSFSRKWFI